MARAQDISTQKLGLLARGSYMQYLFEPNVNEQGTKQWQATLLFPKTADLSALHANALEACEAEWPGKAAEWIKTGMIKSPFLDGDGKQGRDKAGEPKPGYPGHWFIRCTSGLDYRPKLLNQQMLPIADRSGLKSGDYVYAVIGAYTWDSPKMGKGVSFGVSYVLKAKDGESLGGGGGAGSPDQFFEKIKDEGEAPAETKAGAGAAGLFG